MNGKDRTAMQDLKATSKYDNARMDKEVKREKQEKRSMAIDKGSNRRQSIRERKIALQQDVDKLKKKLRHEENVHRALERAFTRPLGALPRLPPYLPSHTLELLAEVALLEEEVVRLEEQVMDFRKGLYQEAIYFSSSSKKLKENGSDSSDECSVFRCPHFAKTCKQVNSHANPVNFKASVMSKPSPSTSHCSTKSEQKVPTSNLSSSGKHIPKKLGSSSALMEDSRGKENRLNANLKRNFEQSMAKKISQTKAATLDVRQADAQTERQAINEDNSSTDTKVDKSSDANRLSEEVLKCLMKIYSGMSSLADTTKGQETLPSVSGLLMSSNQTDCLDPYGICEKFGRREIGPYKMFQSVEVILPYHNSATSSSFLRRKLDLLLRRLAVVDLTQLTHQQKLAFWINIYNSCMMNAILEQGIPSTPEMLVALIPRAMINVGGHLLSAMAIEHFILRLPYNSKHFSLRGQNKDNTTAMRGISMLEWSEPLVTFALSCGSWSSPAVRVYTAPAIENKLEAAKRDYLQAAVGVTLPNKLAIPKLLNWYMLDFAKDVESLMDWVCLQLPSELRAEAVKCLEMSRSMMLEPVKVLHYEFRFRYLFDS